MGEVVATARSDYGLLAPIFSSRASSTDLLAPTGPPGSMNVIAPSAMAPASSNVIAPRSMAQQWESESPFNPFHVPARPSGIVGPITIRRGQAETRDTVMAGSRSHSSRASSRPASAVSVRSGGSTPRSDASVVSVRSGRRDAVSVPSGGSTPRRNAVSVRSGGTTPRGPVSVVSVGSTPASVISVGSRPASAASVRSSAAGTDSSSTAGTVHSSAAGTVNSSTPGAASSGIRFDEVRARQVRRRSRRTRR